MRNQVPERVFFTVPKECNYFAKASKTEIQEGLPRSSLDEKLNNLLLQMPSIVEEIQHFKKKEDSRYRASQTSSAQTAYQSNERCPHPPCPRAAGCSRR